MKAWAAGSSRSPSHVAIAMELSLLVPFTKFAHAIYRPISLFLQSLAQRQAGAAE